MSHRVEDKQARKTARLTSKRVDARQRLRRRAGYGAVTVIGLALVVLALTLRTTTTVPPVDHMTAGHRVDASAGATAPDFNLTDAVSGRQISSASLRGHRTLLFFSEGTGCQACMVQAADLERNKTLSKAGIQLVSVTTDQLADLTAAASQYGIHVPLLADPTGQVSTAYGMLGHGGMGHATQDGHAFMLISAKGKILWHQAYQEMYVKPGQLLSDMKAALQP